ncbi:MAG: hypothetical protein O3A63_18165 [Proteobacteria bacterium]|nr:hypothetical protein [Pseudomonadota bacterium]
MDIYHIWCDLKPGVSAADFVAAVHTYLARMRAEDRLSSYRVTRRKLGLAPAHLKEFHLMLEYDGLAQLDRGFTRAASGEEPMNGFHLAVNQKVQNIEFALYRDYPDAFSEEPT